ncbi:MAG: hypothetical protein WCJ01_05400 [Ignavibacteria bacterium]
MKKIIYIALIALLPAILFAQEKASDSKEQVKDNDKMQQKVETPGKSEADINAKSTRFIDADGDGINDLRHDGSQKPKFMRKNMEKFTDKDGDGINDNRARGMGWSGKGKPKGFGKH